MYPGLQTPLLMPQKNYCITASIQKTESPCICSCIAMSNVRKSAANKSFFGQLFGNVITRRHFYSFCVEVDNSLTVLTVALVVLKANINIVNVGHVPHNSLSVEMLPILSRQFLGLTWPGIAVWTESTCGPWPLRMSWIFCRVSCIWQNLCPCAQFSHLFTVMIYKCASRIINL